MTATLLHYLNKRVLYNGVPVLIVPKLELPLITPLFEFLMAESSPARSCSCCGWKGTELKARKHYLVVAAIEEVELFCPSCNHYLGFLSDPTIKPS
jgi:hypothetical protein